MIDFKEPELFLIRKTENKETHSWLYELMKNVRKETVIHFKDLELNTFSHHEKRQKESLYKYVVIRHMLDESEWLREDISKEDDKPTEVTNLEPTYDITSPYMLDFSKIIKSNYLSDCLDAGKESKLNIKKRRDLLTGEECKIFKSKNALYFISNDEYSIGEILSNIK